MILFIVASILNIYVIGTDKNDMMQYHGDVTIVVGGYMGKYHEYPKSGRDLFQYYEEAAVYYMPNDWTKDYTIWSEGHRKYFKRLLLNPFNIYKRDFCLIWNLKNSCVCVFKGSHAEWQHQSPLLFMEYNQESCFDKDKRYIWKYTETARETYTRLSNELRSKYNYKLCHMIEMPYCTDTLTLGYKIRAVYSISEGLRFGSVLIPDKVFFQPINGDSSPIRYVDFPNFECALESFRKDVEKRLYEMLVSTPDINSVDFYLPVYL